MLNGCTIKKIYLKQGFDLLTMKPKHQIPSDFQENWNICKLCVQKATSHLTIIMYLSLFSWLYITNIKKKLDKFDLLKNNFLSDCSRMVTFANICLNQYICIEVQTKRSCFGYCKKTTSHLYQHIRVICLLKDK